MNETTKVKSKAFDLQQFTPILVILVIGLAFAVGYLFQQVNALKDNVNTPSAVANAPVAPTVGKMDEARAQKLAKVSAEDHIKGSMNADVIIIEYSDLQCPFCSRFHPTVQQAVDEYGDKVAWVYRHFPLDTLHPQARPAAEASECVADLGGNDAFWEFLDYVFENQATALTDIPASAGAIGVSSASVKTCMENDEFAEKVNAQYEAGSAAGVSGTPGNFIINKKGEVWNLPGAVDYATLKSTIDEALES